MHHCGCFYTYMDLVDFVGGKCRDNDTSHLWIRNGKDMKDISILNIGDMIQFVEHMFQPG